MNKIELPEDPKLAKHILDAQTRQRELELESGILGKFFGSNDKIPVYVAGTIALLVLIAGLIYTFIPDQSKTLPTVELWKIISPLIMTCLAYIFGAVSRDRKRGSQ